MFVVSELDVRLTMKGILITLLLFVLTGCQTFELNTGKACTEIANTIRNYYTTKYATFAELTSLRKQQDILATFKRVDELFKVCPVSEIVNSYPSGPYLSFFESTQLSESTISIVSLNLYANEDRTCRVVIRVDKRNKQENSPFSMKAPISKAELIEILK